VADLILPRGKEKILKAEDKDYDRGLLVKLLDNGGYSMKYWYETTDKAAPVEILVDGKSIKKDGKVVEMKFHPKSYYKESKMNLKSLVKETIKEVVTERKLQMFFEKNVPTNPSKWSYYKSQAKKKFDVYPSAYANGWAAKQYKAAGGGWKKG
tara:strand:+ start:34 stop:492 length:459 start_codon:yes stop_codon:yes gene_type:complete